jgi:hypothetical protein
LSTLPSFSLYRLIIWLSWSTMYSIV